MNPRARRLRRQRRKDRVRDAEAEIKEVIAFARHAREAARAAGRRAALADRKAENTDPNHALRVASQIQTGAGLLAQMARALPKV